METLVEIAEISSGTRLALFLLFAFAIAGITAIFRAAFKMVRIKIYIPRKPVGKQAESEAEA